MSFNEELYVKCKSMLDAAISHDVVLGEQDKWAALCENGILDEYPYHQVIRHLMNDEGDRAFLKNNLMMHNVSF